MLIVFDLDGTLIDSGEDLAISTNATRAHLGMPPLPPEVIQTYVGNGARVLVRKALGEDAAEETVEQGLAFFLGYYRAHSLEHTRLYPGIDDLLEELTRPGHTLAVLTNKPVRISTDILEGLHAKERFRRIYGGDSFPTKKPDPAGLLAIVSELGTGARESLMVGDSVVDVQTARNAGVPCCGVLWGFQPESLASAGADLLIGRPPELLAHIRNLSI